jgi:hypothetical protein
VLIDLISGSHADENHWDGEGDVVGPVWFWRDEEVLCDERNSESAKRLMVLIILGRELGLLWQKLNEN